MERELSIGIGKAAQQKHQFGVGDEISGECVPVADERMETAEFYKSSKLNKVSHISNVLTPPVWGGIPPVLEVYRERGHRRLAARTFDTKCTACIWGCRMPVEIIIDNWNPGKRNTGLRRSVTGLCPVKFIRRDQPGKLKAEMGWFI
jgi:hypothetical protein